ncbi:MAG TPA: carbohydrate kinase family protein [Candidatus Hydrogenedentes bacterium]|nr:carbohydrate kinase family protein [Candidatus Hydrogenedentota bacterium]HNT87750.1 carbohydrate kinase family protein [Candidatus Hydrogenedentota bacterium]
MSAASAPETGGDTGRNDYMEREFDVMAAGHLCLDVIPRFADTGARDIGRLLRPGKLVNVGPARISTGGPVSNTGINLKTLGARVCFCARVGDDAFGRLTIDLLRASGHAEGVHVVSGAGSSYTVVIAPPGIDRIFLHNPGTNDTFGLEDLDPALIARCRHFHFGYPPLMEGMYANEGAGLETVLRIAKEAGATTSCDMSLPDADSPSGRAPWRRILERVLPYVDIFLPSVEETLYMLDPDRFLRMKREHQDADLIDVVDPALYSEMATETLGMGAKMVSLKTGHRGFYLRTGPAAAFDGMGAARPGDPENWADRELWAPAFVVPQFGSATGSGDSAIAGFLAAYVRGCTIEQALRCATCCGWQNVQVLDAVSGIRSWEETTALLDERMPHIDAQIDATGWRWDAEIALWRGPNDRA